MKLDPHRRPRWWRAYSFVVITAVLFVLAWAGQLFFQLIVARDQADTHDQVFSWAGLWAQFWASTLENWQSEFLQLIWQTAGLTFLYCWGSSQSREGTDRIEAKIDEVLRRTPDRRMFRDSDSGPLP